MNIAEKINTLDNLTQAKRRTFKSKRLKSKPLLPDITKLILDIEEAKDQEENGARTVDGVPI